MQGFTGNIILMHSQHIVSVCLFNTKTKSMQNIEAGSTVGQNQIMKPIMCLNVHNIYLLLYKFMSLLNVLSEV